MEIFLIKTIIGDMYTQKKVVLKVLSLSFIWNPLMVVQDTKTSSLKVPLKVPSRTSRDSSIVKNYILRVKFFEVPYRGQIAFN